MWLMILTVRALISVQMSVDDCGGVDVVDEDCGGVDVVDEDCGGVDVDVDVLDVCGGVDVDVDVGTVDDQKERP